MPKALLGFGAIIVAYVLYTCVNKEEVVAVEKAEEKVEVEVAPVEEAKEAPAALKFAADAFVAAGASKAPETKAESVTEPVVEEPVVIAEPVIEVAVPILE